MKNRDLSRLLKRYLKGECTEEERAFVETWYNKILIHDTKIAEDEIESDLIKVRSRLRKQPVRHLLVSWRRYAAAVAILIIGASTYIYLTRSKQTLNASQDQLAALMAADIHPGGNRATLTLADGRTIDLSAEQSGIAIGDGIMYLDGSMLVNQDSEDGNPTNGYGTSNMKPLTLTTPKGGQYQIMLPDGTKVWLNAASSLAYKPTDRGKERIVHLEGEAYFEVATDEKRPFKVITDGQVVEVLGTHFNINSYADEPVQKTVLLEGSVKVTGTAMNNDVLLWPGEQAQLGADNRLEVSRVSVMDAIAWKNGLFRFDNTDIETIMRQLSRWYDVEVLFEGKKPAIQLWGQVYRSESAVQALEILAYFDLKYRIETENGIKRIIIYS